MLNRNQLIQDLADSACDSIDIKDLLRFYYDSQIEWAESLSDTELLDYAEDYLSDFNLEDYQMLSH